MTVTPRWPAAMRVAQVRVSFSSAVHAAGPGRDMREALAGEVGQADRLLSSEGVIGQPHDHQWLSEQRLHRL